MDTNKMILQLMEIVTDMAESQRRLEIKMDKRFDAMEKAVDERFDAMHDEMDERFDAVHNEIRNVKLDVLSVKMTIENNIEPAIKMISEGQVENSKRLTEIESDITEIKDNSAIDEVLRDLRDMKRV